VSKAPNNLACLGLTFVLYYSVPMLRIAARWFVDALINYAACIISPSCDSCQIITTFIYDRGDGERLKRRFRFASSSWRQKSALERVSVCSMTGQITPALGVVPGVDLRPKGKRSASVFRSLHCWSCRRQREPRQPALRRHDTCLLHFWALPCSSAWGLWRF
jgi:hypothetical protein